MKYPYFRGLEADRYSFYRVPKALIKVDLFEKMSGDAKLLYAVLLDRMNLSLKNGWQDENGNAYIICTIDEIMDSIRCARQKAVKLLDELEHEYQLVERRRQGLGKPNLLYVKDLYAGLSQSNYWKYENQTSGGLKSELPGVWKSNGSKTDEKTSEIAAQVGRTPQNWNSSVFSMIQNLSESVVVPIAGIIITLVLCYELISMLTERNNLHDVDTWMFFKYFVKAWVAIYLVSNTFTITMAVFDVGQSVVNSASGIINGETAIDVSSLSMQMQAAMATMEIGELVVLALETFLVSFCMKIMSVVITVIVYGRMIEIYLYTSLAPIPFATMSNREWGHVGTNYFRGLFALAFQAFLMMVCVAIYAALISSVRISSNMHSALIGVAAYTVILCFSLMKTGSLSKQIFGSH